MNGIFIAFEKQTITRLIGRLHRTPLVFVFLFISMEDAYDFKSDIFVGHSVGNKEVISFTLSWPTIL